MQDVKNVCPVIGQVRAPFFLAIKALSACLLHMKVALQGIPTVLHLQKAFHHGLIPHLRFMVLAEVCLCSSASIFSHQILLCILLHCYSHLHCSVAGTNRDNLVQYSFRMSH